MNQCCERFVTFLSPAGGVGCEYVVRSPATQSKDLHTQRPRLALIQIVSARLARFQLASAASGGTTRQTFGWGIYVYEFVLGEHFPETQISKSFPSLTPGLAAGAREAGGEQGGRNQPGRARVAGLRIQR
jgi:hypothetical protein